MNSSFLSVFKTREKSIKSKVLPYMLGLLLTKGRKNCASMAREQNVPYNLIRDALVDDFDYIEYCKQNQVRIIKELASQGSPGYLIIDFTMAVKRFLSTDNMVTYDYDGSTKRTQKGFSLGIAAWSNGKVTIPVTIEYWLRKKDAGTTYKKKVKLVKEMIYQLKQDIPFLKVLLDGSFVSVDLLQFFNRTFSNR